MLMSTAHRTLLLLNSDPVFAAGAGSFSSGLETLAGDGWVLTSDDLRQVIHEALVLRWNTFDRVFLSMAYQANGELSALLDVHDQLEMQLFGAAARSASRRAGAAAIGMWARLGLTEAVEMRMHRPTGLHLPIAQAVIANAQQMSLGDLESIAGWSVITSYASSALRLGMFGHLKIQELLIDASQELDRMLGYPVPASAEPFAWTPNLDIALERHSEAEVRLFAS